MPSSKPPKPVNPWNDPRFLKAAPIARLLYLALLQSADDNGNVALNLPYLKGRYFPLERTAGIWRTSFLELSNAGLLVPYQHDGAHYAFLPEAPLPKTKRRVECPLRPGQVAPLPAALAAIEVPADVQGAIDAFVLFVGGKNASGRVTEGRAQGLQQAICELVVEFGPAAVKFGLQQAQLHEATAVGYVRAAARSFREREGPNLRVVGGTGDVRDLPLHEIRERTRR